MKTLNTDTLRLVLQNIGPKGHPGMPEADYIPIPRKLAQRGVKDIVRISDGRMSGTASGAVVLHVSPEAAVGGPLAAVQDGDEIELNVEARSLRLVVSEEDIVERLKGLTIQPTASRGYRKLYLESVLQADQGADFDFLRACADE
jgi:dihydroxy-acid dehydratase